jgi:hypothetical protein
LWGSSCGRGGVAIVKSQTSRRARRRRYITAVVSSRPAAPWRRKFLCATPSGFVRTGFFWKCSTLTSPRTAWRRSGSRTRLWIDRIGARRWFSGSISECPPGDHKLAGAAVVTYTLDSLSKTASAAVALKAPSRGERRRSGRHSASRWESCHLAGFGHEPSFAHIHV